MGSEASVIKIVATSTGTADDLTSIDIPEDGEIIAVNGVIQSPDAALAEGNTVELSFLSVNQMTANDARGSIFNIVGRAQGGTGVIGYAVNSNLTLPKGIPVVAGERIHLHNVMSAAHTCIIQISLIILLSGGGRQNKRR
jgi:hypothetical protein